MSQSCRGPTAEIFISYRRDDARAYAAQLFEDLGVHFGVNRVLIDLDFLSASDLKGLDEVIGNCFVLVAAIGSLYTTFMDSLGRPRLDNPTDRVRLEVSAALSRSVPVIPLLVDGASLPAPSELPRPMRMMLRGDVITLNHERWQSDVRRLIARIEGLARSSPSPNDPAVG